jgi:DMSO/TMAO reductase YedYZ molybdopterin-dependent catalytic subunit
VVENVSLFPASGRGVFGVSAWPWPAAMEMVWLLTSIIYSFLFTGLTMKRESARKPEEAPDLSRRLFLKRLAYAGAGLVLAGAFGSYLWRLIESGRRSLTGTGRISSEITPNEDFYAVSKNFIPPVVDARSWNLEIKGLVDHDLTISYKRLKEFPSSTYYLTLECIGNEIGGQQVGNAKWKGTLLRDVLSLVSIDSSAKKVVLYGTDDYTDSITPDQALAADVLLAYEMNDEPLPSEHGFPVRLLIPGIYGMKNVKWVTKLEFVDYDYQGFWEEAGWSDKAVIQTMSRIDAPLSGARVGTAESVTIGGIAFAGDRGISEVQVSTDGGKMWNKVRVKEALSPYSWSLWAYDWAPPGSGTYTTLVRAIDGHGTLQTQTVRQPLPDGATGYDSTIIVAATKP